MHLLLQVFYQRLQVLYQLLQMFYQRTAWREEEDEDEEEMLTSVGPEGQPVHGGTLAVCLSRRRPS